MARFEEAHSPVFLSARHWIIQVCSITFPLSSQTMVLKIACVSVKRTTRFKFPSISALDNSPRRSLYRCASSPSSQTLFGSRCLALCCTIAEKPSKRRVSHIYNGWNFQSVLICCNSFSPLLSMHTATQRWRVRPVNTLSLCQHYLRSF